MLATMDIYALLAGNEDFELPIDHRTVVVRRIALGAWNVYHDTNLIGSFTERQEGRATFFQSEIASEPGTTNWVSDDPTVLASRMLTLAES
jgi:hypothetical protein